MISVIAFMDKVLGFIQLYLKKLQEKKAQDERNKLENDPFDWYVHHFDGVSDKSTKTKTNETDINYPAK